ncbi:MAG: hypothetical protein ACREJN_07560, partial [Nitrospiraceae bacterium]
MELDHDDSIAASAAKESCNEQKKKGKSMCHALNSAEFTQDAQTGYPTRPQGESSTEACCLCTLRRAID